ncbi:MAG: recombination mediator RecR [Bacteroidales bacterium]|nr:recombination mediator RecR [Bacteroidales bacterium]
MDETTVPSRYLQAAVNELSRLPSIGKRTALRLALYILKQDPLFADTLSDAIRDLSKVNYCKTCHNISDGDICDICSSIKRESSVVCVIEDTRDFIAIESTGQYNGLYHILGGVISPINGVGINDLTIENLVKRVEEGNFKEIILALPTTIEGDTTSLYLYKRLSRFGVAINTIARGVAFGDDLEYADQITLGRSILNRVPYCGMSSNKSI